MTETANLDVAVLKAANYAAADEETRYYLRGVCVEIAADCVTYIATDGHILFAHRALTDVNTMRGVYIIPSDTIDDIRLGKKDITQATLERGDYPKLILRTHNATRMTVFEPVDGTFPDWRRVTPAWSSGKTECAYDPQLMIRLWKASKAMGGGMPDLSPNDDKAALVLFGVAGTFGLIMPMRALEGSRESPDWVHSVAEREGLKAVEAAA